MTTQEKPTTYVFVVVNLTVPKEKEEGELERKLGGPKPVTYEGRPTYRREDGWYRNHTGRLFGR